MNVSISIIVPAYNEETFIMNCLLSVGNQTYSGPMECIIVDDCGPDNTMCVVESFLEKYNGVVDFRIVHHEKNRGVSSARNTGIDEAKGDFIFFLDSDDLIKPDCIKQMVECVNKYPNVEIVFAGTDVVGRDWGFMDIRKKDLPSFSNNPLWIKKTMLERFTLGMTPWNRLVRRSFLVDNHLYFADGVIHEDELWNFELAQSLTSIAICHDNTYIYQYRERSITGNETVASKLGIMIQLWSRMIAEIDPVLCDAQAKSVCRQILEWPMWKMSIKGKITLRRVLLNASKYLEYVDRVAIAAYVLMGSIALHVPALGRFIRSRFQYTKDFSCVIE